MTAGQQGDLFMTRFTGSLAYLCSNFLVDKHAKLLHRNIIYKITWQPKGKGYFNGDKKRTARCRLSPSMYLRINGELRRKENLPWIFTMCYRHNMTVGDSRATTRN